MYLGYRHIKKWSTLPKLIALIVSGCSSSSSSPISASPKMKQIYAKNYSDNFIKESEYLVSNCVLLYNTKDDPINRDTYGEIAKESVNFDRACISIRNKDSVPSEISNKIVDFLTAYQYYKGIDSKYTGTKE